MITRLTLAMLERNPADASTILQAFRNEAEQILEKTDHPKAVRSARRRLRRIEKLETQI